MTLGLFILGDVATSIVNFAANLTDGATISSISFKEWLTFSGSTAASIVFTIRGLMSSAWTDARKKPEEPTRNS